MHGRISHWEWRTFPRTIEAPSSEIYLSATTAEGNAKIGGDKLDIKALQRVDEEGLEQSKPVMMAIPGNLFVTGRKGV